MGGFYVMQGALNKAGGLSRVGVYFCCCWFKFIYIISLNFHHDAAGAPLVLLCLYSLLRPIAALNLLRVAGA